MYGHDCRDCGRYPGSPCCFEADADDWETLSRFTQEVFDEESYLDMLAGLPENHNDVDYRFDCQDVSNEDGPCYLVTRIRTLNGRDVAIESRDRFGSRHEVYNEVEAFRECQTMTLEERMDYYYERGF